MDKFSMVAKTFKGLEGVLAEELTGIGAEEVIILNRAVSFTGDKEMMYRANFRLRTALRILRPVINAKVKNEVQLYNAVKSIQWKDYLENRDTIAIDSVVVSEYFGNSMFVSQKVKDAIVDQLRDNTGRRPSVNTENPTLKINVHLAHDDLTVSLDSSGDSLHKRGYRVSQGLAPLSEVLAAGMIMLTGWKGNTNFVDPMCGSGTLLIEAAMIAFDIPPGVFRKSFGFERWPDFDNELYEKVTEETEEKKNIDITIAGADISRRSIESAGRNILNAMLGKKISISLKPIDDFIPPASGGLAVINPPYGERMKLHELNSLYTRMGDAFKRNFNGYDVWIISSDIDALKKIGLRTSQKLNLYNGALECKYHKYEIYRGSKK
ncbi:MAG: RNA methyltransferase [Bacteroidales bacterium]|nr:RNA methyltransferase [Bacteroidales bacterium]